MKKHNKCVKCGLDDWKAKDVWNGRLWICRGCKHILSGLDTITASTITTAGLKIKDYGIERQPHTKL